MNFGFWDGSGTLQEIEIAALVSLLDVLHVQPSVSAVINPLFRFPGSATPAKLVIIHPHIQLAFRHIEFDDVSVLQQRQWPADERFG